MAWFRHVAASAVLGVALAIGAAAAQPAGPRPTSPIDWILQPDAAVDGTGFAEWTARWWGWALSQPVAPFLDPDGRLCESGQDGPVWFLAGTDGDFTAERECTVPEGKYILLPVINMVQWSRLPAPTAKDCREMRHAVAVNNDALVSAVVVVDGVAVPDVKRLRVRSDHCFPIAARARAAAVDGYWLLLRPLPRGRHTITVGANYNACACNGYGTMVQNFEYVLDVGGRVNAAMAAPDRTLHSRGASGRANVGSVPSRGNERNGRTSADMHVASMPGVG